MTDPVQQTLDSWLLMLSLAESGDRVGFKREAQNQVRLYRQLRDRQGDFHHALAAWYEREFAA